MGWRLCIWTRTKLPQWCSQGLLMTMLSTAHEPFSAVLNVKYVKKHNKLYYQSISNQLQLSKCHTAKTNQEVICCVNNHLFKLVGPGKTFRQLHSSAEMSFLFEWSHEPLHYDLAINSHMRMNQILYGLHTWIAECGLFSEPTIIGFLMKISSPGLRAIIKDLCK